MAKAKQRPLRQSVRTKFGVAQLAVSPQGDVFFVAPSWRGLQVHTWADAKTRVIEAPTIKCLTLVGDALLAAASFDYERQRDQAVVVDRNTGKQTALLDTKGEPMTSIQSVSASPDGKLVAVAFGFVGARSGIEIFGVDGRHLQSVSLRHPAGGVFFSLDSATLSYFSEGSLFRLPVGGKKATGVSCKVPDERDARVTRQGDYLLVQSAGYGHQLSAFVVEEKTSKLVLEVPGAEVASWGPVEGTVVWCTQELVKVLDLKGKELGSFKRDRGSRFEAAAPSPHGFWIGGGSFLEIFDFNRMQEVAGSNPAPDKKRAPNRPPEILKPSKGAAASGDQLLQAIWRNPHDVEALRVWADWLFEQGSTRGEYTQLCLLEGKTEEQEQAASRLLKQHRGEWLGEARPFVRSWTDSYDPPGFVSRVWCEAIKFIEGFEHIMKLGPRMAVTVTSMRTKRRDTEARMAKLPLGQVWDLDLSSNALDDAGLMTLVPAMKGLKTLRLDGNEITGKGLAALGAQVDTLESLTLWPQVSLRDQARTDAADGFAQALVETPGFRSLVTLDFRGTPPSQEWRKKLAALPRLKELKA